MVRFFTSDLHLGHRNIARYEPGRATAAGVPPLGGPADDEVWILGGAVMGQLDRNLGQLRRLLGRVVLLHGHVHSTWRTNGRMINVGVDVRGYRPVPEEEIIELVREATQFS